ncbi:S1C family serine protease [Yinghuangia soli]|uniref:S1C family serine protease n=1 Tax=Yinghuangia soli TaxID=2908204 RepID=UPI00254642E0|nr:trypsin-like peptidase domain-containing protein [Yinghuangia soli]
MPTIPPAPPQPPGYAPAQPETSGQGPMAWGAPAEQVPAPESAGFGTGHGEAPSAGDGSGGEPPHSTPSPSGPADASGPGHGRTKPRVPRLVTVAVAAAVAAGLTGGVAGGLISGRIDNSASGSQSGAPVQNAADKKGLSGIPAVADAASPSVVEISVQTPNGKGTGSGVVYTADGKIITNAHVVSGAVGGKVTVKLADGREVTGRVIGSDKASDIALVKIDGVDGLKPAVLGDSSQVKVGDQVVAIGSPEGLTGTVTSGIISALNREVKVAGEQQGQGQGQLPPGYGGGSPFGDSPYGGSPFGNSADGTNSGQDTGATKYQALQTDASINPGNSGGPLLDMNGRVIGINSAIYSPTSGGEAGSVGLGFSIPINKVKEIVKTLEANAGGLAA